MIFVSVGHHQYSKGAKFEDFNEFDEAKLWVPLIVNYLGHDAMAVPVGVLNEKVSFINDACKLIQGEHIAIEIHFNMAWRDKNKDGYVDEDEFLGNGSETLYYPGNELGRSTAEHIQEQLSNVFPPNRGAKEGYYQMNKSKGADYFLARTSCVALIIEPEFVHHKDKIIEARTAGCAVIASQLKELIGEK